MVFRKPFEFNPQLYEGKTVQIDGVNNDDEKSKSNGSGKSTLLETLNWGLFGELCRKSRYKDEMIHKKEKKARIQIEFETHELQSTVDNATLATDYKVIRIIERKKTPSLQIWKDSIETLVGATYQTKQDELEKVLGMNFLSFQCYVMFGRDFMNFPDLKPSDRAKILTDIRGLEKYLDASRRAKESSNAEAFTAVELGSSLSNREGKLAGVRATTYKDQLDNFELVREERIADWTYDAETKQASLEEKKKEQKEKIDGIEEKLAFLEDRKEMLISDTSTRKVFADRSSDAQTEIARILFEKSSYSGNIVKINNEIQKLTKSGKGPCPFCSQTITGEYLQSKINQLGLEIMEINSIINDLASKEKIAGENVRLCNKDLDAIDKLIEELETVKNEISDLKVDWAKLQQNSFMATLESEIKTLGIRINNKIEEVNPYIEMEEKRKNQIKILGVEIRNINTQITEVQNRKNYFDIWVDGFKKIRMMIFDTMISQLEHLAQGYLSQYSSELNIVMTTERETRSGTIKDEFHIAIIDTNGDEISYEMYSGGERQKIRLSISRALAQFIKEGCGVDFNVVAFDEPNDSLDDVGKEINFNTFEELSEKEGKAVLVTDHDSTFKEKFDYNIVVIKENGESVIHVQ
jgi:DNA repair exonuclease SbcCD ATPase subunit